MCTTAQAAEQIGVCKNTLLRWVNEGLIPEVHRDWRGWRVWSEKDINTARAFKKAYHARPIPRVRRRAAPKASYGKSVAESMAQYGRAWEKGRKGPA